MTTPNNGHRRTPAAFNAPELHTPADVHRAMTAKLLESGINGEAKTLGMRPLTVEQLEKEFPKIHRMLPAPGFKIPYFDINGKPTKHYRIRFLGAPKRSGFSALTEHKDPKYLQEPDTGSKAYFSPLNSPAAWKFLFSGEANRPVFITEGENKANCACIHEIPCVGLGGVWCWRVKETKALIPDLDKLNWKNLHVYIVFDSDAASNFQIVMAENALAKELLARGAQVYIMRIPALTPGKKTGLDDYILAQGAEAFLDLAKATEPWVRSQKLHELNEEVIYLETPGVLRRWRDGHMMRAGDFTQHQYSNWRITQEVTMPNGGVRTTETNAARVWLDWEGRASAPRATYAPGEERINSKGEVNLWMGWGAESEAGDVALWKELLRHLIPEDRERKIFERWLAYPLQHPGAKMAFAVVLWSLVQGVGKTTIYDTMSRIYGADNCSVVDEAQLESGFNKWEHNKQLIFVEEICASEKMHVARKLKGRITQRNVTINSKNIPEFTIPDRANYLFTSNEPNALRIDNADRRYFVYEITSAPREAKFYEDYHTWLNGKGAAAIHAHLLSVNMDGFNPNGAAPMTDAKAEMAAASMSNAEAWAVGFCTSGPVWRQEHGAPVEIPLIWFRDGEVQALFRQANPDVKNMSVMRNALTKAGLRSTKQPVRCGDKYGQVRLRALRPIPGALSQAEIGKAMQAERVAWAKAVSRMNLFAQKAIASVFDLELDQSLTPKYQGGKKA